MEEVNTGGLAFWLTGFGRQLRVMVIGVRGVGKSVIIRRLTGHEMATDGGETSDSASLRGVTMHWLTTNLYLIITAITDST